MRSTTAPPEAAPCRQRLPPFALMPKFEFVDYLIVVAYLAGIVALATHFSGRQKSLSEYFHAGASIPWWAVGISNLATAFSPISYLAMAGWIFLKDSRNSLVADCLGLALLPLTAAIWLPLWSRLRVLSIYEYLEIRYHPWIRSAGAILFLMVTTIWAGTAMTTTGMGFEQATGFDARWCIVAITLLGTAYTAMGSMRAVIWTDVAQFSIFVAGYAAILFFLLGMFDWQPLEIYRIASNTVSPETGHPHTQLISFELDATIEATFWVLLFNKMFLVLSFGANQWEIQRLHSTRSRREMLKAMVGGKLAMILVAFVSIPTAWGLVAFYAQQPDLKAAIPHPDQVLPAFVATQLPHLVRSLIMAGVLAALMSSLDSAINSMGSVTVNDFIRRYLLPRAPERHLVFVAKALTFVFGAVVLAFSVWQLQAQGETAFEKLGRLTAVIAAPMPSFFALGVLSRRVNTRGAIIGAVAGMTFSILFNGIPGLLERPVGGINWMWIAGLATAVNLVVGYAASYLFPPPPAEVLDRVHR